MAHTFVFEEFQTVPVVSLSDMTPYMQVEEGNPLNFPIPGEEFNFMRLDLSRALIRHPGNTFFVHLTDDSLAEAGYSPGDIAIVDRQVSPRHRDVIIAYLEGEFTIRRLKIVDDMPAVESDEGIEEIEPDTDFTIWGVVKDVIRI